LRRLDLSDFFCECNQALLSPYLDQGRGQSHPKDLPVLSPGEDFNFPAIALPLQLIEEYPPIGFAHPDSQLFGCAPDDFIVFEAGRIKE
jgi:hypothetical protein